jgi:hypothetical protein
MFFTVKKKEKELVKVNRNGCHANTKSQLPER